MATFSPKDPELRLAKLREAKVAGFYPEKPIRLDGRQLDPMSADLILAVYGGLSEANRALFIVMPYPKMWRVAKGLLDRGAVSYSIGGSSRTKRRFTAAEWVGAPGREWRDAHRCSTPHNSSEENSRAQCPAWRAVSPAPTATRAAIARIHASRGQSRTASRAARRAGRR